MLGAIQFHSYLELLERSRSFTSNHVMEEILRTCTTVSIVTLSCMASFYVDSSNDFILLMSLIDRQQKK